MDEMQMNSIKHSGFFVTHLPDNYDKNSRLIFYGVLSAIAFGLNWIWETGQMFAYGAEGGGSWTKSFFILHFGVCWRRDCNNCDLRFFEVSSEVERRKILLVRGNFGRVVRRWFRVVRVSFRAVVIRRTNDCFAGY